MSTDRELLELAAKAFWGEEIDDVVSVEWSDEDSSILYTHADNQDHNGIDRAYRWNPLEEDADALQLAVKLRLIVGTSKDDYAIVRRTGGDYPDEFCDAKAAGPYAATRRAIVKAAAAIGRETS